MIEITTNKKENKKNKKIIITTIIEIKEISDNRRIDKWKGRWTDKGTLKGKDKMDRWINLKRIKTEKQTQK